MDHVFDWILFFNSFFVFSKVQFSNEFLLDDSWVPIIQGKEWEGNEQKFNESSEITNQVDDILGFVIEFLNIVPQEKIERVQHVSFFNCKRFTTIFRPDSKFCFDLVDNRRVHKHVQELVLSFVHVHKISIVSRFSYILLQKGVGVNIGA